MNFNIPPSNGVPILGQQQVPIMQAVALITPDLVKKMERWSKKVGLPMNEIQNTIFRMGLIMFSVSSLDEPTITEADTINLIPMTINEEKTFRTDPD